MKKDNLKIIALITAIIVITASVIGAVVIMSGEHENTDNNTGTEGNGNNTGGNENEGTYVHTISRRYSVIINSKGNYTVYVPVVLGRNGLSYMMDNLTLESGNCTYKIENTTYGLALNITGRGYVEFQAAAFYQENIVNWTVINTSGVNPSKGHPITLSMSNISELHCEINKSGNISVVTGYNTTNDSFRDNICWKEYVNNSMLLNEYYSFSYPISLHSFVYAKSEKPVDIHLTLCECFKGELAEWELEQKFDTNGWHYVELNITGYVE